MAEVALPFSLRGRPGRVAVSVVANDDPAGYGSGAIAGGDTADVARGYPVCEARVEIDAVGYSAACGWMQVVRSTDGSGDWEMDPLALFDGIPTPFAFFGIAPTLFDAPFRRERYDLDWSARSFLCAVPDAVVSRWVAPLCGFTWGFVVANGSITLLPLEPLNLSEWNPQLPLFREQYPAWTFDAADHA